MRYHHTKDGRSQREPLATDGSQVDARVCVSRVSGRYLQTKTRYNLLYLYLVPGAKIKIIAWRVL